MRSTWGWRATISASPAALGYLQFANEDYPVRLVALDTLVSGQHGGMLCAERLGWLDTALAAQLDRPTLGRQVAGVPKSLAQRLSGIMIAGNHEDRHRQGCQQMAQLFVFVRLAVIDEIAGHYGDIGPWHQRV